MTQTTVDVEEPLDTYAAMSGIVQRFGSFVALDDVTFDVRRGEVHALVGENGAGKSTLMKILAGQLAASEGTLGIGGRTGPAAEAPGLSVGVGFVEQEGGLVDELTATENLVLSGGSGLLAGRRAHSRAIRDRAAELGLTADPDVPVGSLPIGDKQRLEVLVALAAGAEVLVLDEPTASLGIEDAAVLADLIRDFVGSGGSVVYVSHKLREVIAIADRVTVLRRGRVVGHYEDTAGLSVQQLADDMVGEIAGDAARRVAAGEAGESLPTASERVACRLQDVSVASRPSTSGQSTEALDGCSLEVRAGEVLGIAGVVGSGQSTLAEVLVGLRDPDVGHVEREPGAAAFIPEHRRDHAIAVAMSVADNAVVHSHRRLGQGPFLSRGAVREHARRIVEEYDVRTPGLDVAVGALSGGNQQRLVVGRELDEAPVLVVAHNPFRGLDVRAISDVEHALLAAARRGAGVVVISPDLEEIMPICTRIAVLFDGQVVGDVDPTDPRAGEVIGRLMGGAR